MKNLIVLAVFLLIGVATTSNASVLIFAQNGTYITSFPDLPTASTAPSAAGKDMVMTSTETLTGAVSIAGCTFHVADGAAILFSGAGSLTFGPGVVDAITAEMFGASNNATNSAATTVGINAALVTQANSNQITNGMIGFGGSIPVKLKPNGKYLIGGSLTMYPYADVIGDDSAIMTSATYPYAQTYPIFIGSSAMTKFTGINFFGGTNQLQLNTGAATTIVRVTDCKFLEYSLWAVVSMQTDNVTIQTSPHATHLIVTRPVFIPHSGVTTAGAMSVSYDHVSVIHPEADYISGPSAFTNYDALFVDGLFIAAPGTGEASTAVWFTNYGRLHVTNTRFGGEAGSRSIFANYAGNGGVGYGAGGGETSVKFNYNQVFTGGNSIGSFYDLPDNFTYEDNMGDISMTPWVFSSAIPVASMQNASKLLFSSKRNSQGEEFGSSSSTNFGAAQTGIELSLNQPVATGTSTILSSQLVASVAGGGSWGSHTTGMTVSTGTDMFGEATLTVVGFDSATTNEALVAYGSLSGMPAGVYTVATNVTVSGNPVKYMILAAGGRRIVNLGPGSHTITCQFYYDGTSSPAGNVEIQIAALNVDAVTTVALSGFRLFSGRVTTTGWVDTFYGTAIPTSTSILHKKGDQVINQPMVAGSPKGWVCTVTGSPGTWVSLGNL